MGRQDERRFPAVPSAARRHRQPPLAYDVERVLRTALTGPAVPGVDVGLDILDAGGDEPDGRAGGRSGRHEGGPAGRRHGASATARYLRSVLVADAAVGAAAAVVGSALRPDGQVGLPGLLLPPALVVSLGLSGAYERRVLLAGFAEYGRAVRAGVGLLGAALPAAALAPVTLPPSYAFAVVPVATAGAVAGRIVIRRWHRFRNSWLTRAVAGGRPMRR